MCSVIQGDNNLLRPLFKCHFCRYQLEGIQVYDGGWQVALIGRTAVRMLAVSTATGLFELDTEPGYLGVKEDHDDPRFGELQVNRHQRNTVAMRENTVCLESGPCTGGVTVKRKPETRALSFVFLFSVFKSASRLVLTDTLTPTVKHSISALTTLSRQGEHEEEHWSHRNGLKPGTKPGCFPIPWVSRAVLPTGKERGAAEHASIPARPEKARKKSCTPPDTVGCAVIDLIHGSADD